MFAPCTSTRAASGRPLFVSPGAAVAGAGSGYKEAMEAKARAELEKLEPLVGQWSVEAVAPWAPPDGPRGHTIFQWGPGEGFLIQRWETSVDIAPDGVAILAVDEESGDLVQHYFDSRGVVRRYATSIEDGIWSLRKLTPGFAQRFLGEFSTDGNMIDGAWEKSEEGSPTWEHDFDLIYRRVS
jgi:hypothetical protein